MALRLANGTPIPTSRLKPRADTILAVPHRYQEQTNWCWAGCSEMIYIFLGITTWHQCHMAQVLFGADCCSAPSSGVCNQGNWPGNALDLVAIRWVLHNTTWSMWGVRHELAGNRPLICYYEWTGTGAHVAVIRGIYDNGDLDVHDPWYGPGRRTYDNILHAYGYGTWTKTYTGIQR